MELRQGDPRRPYTVQRAAGIVFGLAAVLPLCLFAYTLYVLEGYHHPQLLAMLGLGIVTSLTGLYIFRGLVARLDEMLRDAGPSQAGSGETSPLHIPGFGTVVASPPRPGASLLLAEVDGLRMLWQAEAQPHLDRPVLVSVRNSAVPLAGVLSQVTEDGLLLEAPDGARLAISYRRMSAIEPDRSRISTAGVF